MTTPEPGIRGPADGGAAVDARPHGVADGDVSFHAPGRFQRTLEDGRIQCDLCPRHCRLHDGQRAFCFVRQRSGERIYLTTYGRASGFCLDPIEKKPLNHFYPGTSVLSFGTAGCNLGCKFCQNWDISKAKEIDKLGDLATPEGVAELALAYSAKSVAFTYNDPVIFAEYAIDCAAACHERGIPSVAVTAGYIDPSARGEFFAAMDAVNVDLKGFTEKFYQQLCFAALGPVLETLKYVKRETQTWLEVTTLLIPGQNDSPDEIDRLCDWFAAELGPDVPLHFTAFHPDYRMRGIPATPAATLRRARRQAQTHGLRYVYTGNVHDPDGQSTYCGTCSTLVIERDRYTLGTYALADSRCRACGAEVPGHFDGGPGRWGMKRLRVFSES